MICEIKKIAPEKVSDIIKENIYKFIYMSNNGFFFTAICYSPMMHDLSIGYITLVVSGIILVIGSIILLRDLKRSTEGNCCTDFSVVDKLKSYFKIPCDYVWKFIGLTDPCCVSTTYTVTIYSDGTTSSTKSCVECWNLFVLILKRVVLIISTILFYIFLIYLTIIFLFFKLFYLLITNSIKCCQNSNNQNSDSNIPHSDVIISNNGNLGNQQNLENNGQKQDSNVQLENQLNNYIINNQIQNPKQPTIENLNNQANNTTKLVIKDKSDNNLPFPEMPNNNNDNNQIININIKEN